MRSVGARTIWMVTVVALFSLNLLLHTSSVRAQQQQYLCVAEKSSGFAFDRVGGWRGATFRTESKYLITRSKAAGWTWQVVKIGDDDPTIMCKQDFNESGYLFCEGIGGYFRFNRKNGRFLVAYVFGYYNVLPGNKLIETDEKSDTPNLEIGKCSPW